LWRLFIRAIKHNNLIWKVVGISPSGQYLKIKRGDKIKLISKSEMRKLK
jgi:hypothetical protein